MTADKAIYKCPCCEYRTHFLKALEAHQKFLKHYKPAPVVEKVEVVPAEIKEEVPTEEEVVVVKKTRKPRAKKTAEKE